MITYEYRLPHDINSFRRSVGWYELSPRQLNCALKSSVFAITALDGEKEVGSARVVGEEAISSLSAMLLYVPNIRDRE